MIQSIKRKYTVRLLFRGLMFIIIGLALLTYLGWDYLPIGVVQDLDAEGISAVTTGRAQMTVYHVDGCFSYFTDDYDKTVTMDFLAPVGDSDMWIGVRLEGKQMDAINSNMELYWDTYDRTEGALDWDALYSQYSFFWLNGRIEKMDSETEGFYKQYLSYYNMSDEELENFLPYIFIPARFGRDLESLYVVFAVIIVMVLLGYGVYYIIDAFAALYLKEMKRFISNSGSSESQMARLEQFYDSVPEIDGFKINDDYFMYLGKGGFKFAKSADVLWAYQHVLTTNYVAKTYTLKICFADGKVLDVPTTKKGYEPLVQSVERRLPDIVIGYSDQLKDMFSKNRQQFVNEVSRRRRERMGSVDNAYAFSDNNTDFNTDNN